jgi:hypothetical protein
MRRAVLATLALAALLACESASAAPRATAVRVTVDRDGAGGRPASTLRLTCGERTRTPGCRALRKLPREALAAPDPGELCTQIYGGPETARITGRVGGRRVDAAFHRTNGCGIARWELAAPLLALAG